MGHFFRRPRLRDPRVAPCEPVMLDRDHPLAQHAVAVFVPGATGFVDLCGNGVLAPGTGAIVPTACEGAGYRTVDFADAASGPITPAWNVATPALFWRGEMLGGRSGTGLPWMFGSDNAADNNRAWLLYNDGAGGNFYFVSGNTYINSTVAIPAARTPGVALGAAADGAGNVALFAAGAQAASAAASLKAAGLSNRLYLGGACSATTEIAVLFDATAPMIDWAWLAAEPFAMLRPMV